MADSPRVAMIDYGSGNLRSVEKALQHSGAEIFRAESPEARGLAHWRGRVVKFPERPGLKVPHMGWNSLELRAREPIFAGLSDPAFVYFVHSFYPEPAEADLITAACTHGVPFAAGCRRGNVRGVQFHPEKSQTTGLRMLENFVDELRGVTN